MAHGTPAALSLATGILLLVCWAASALAAPARYQGSLDNMVRYLQNDQNADGGFGGEPGESSNNDISAWVALALAAAGINPRDQTPAGQHYIGGHSVYGYLTEQASKLSSTTDFERELLVVDATGTSPTDFGGVNLLEKILERQLTKPGSNDGAFVHEAGSGEPGMNDTIFAIIALSPIHESTIERAVQAAAEWVEREQDCDHGWPSTAYRTGGACPAGGGSLVGEPQSEVDMTGAAIQALNAAGRQGAAKEIERHAFEYLKTAQDADGGFPSFHGEREPDVASTAWVVQAMWSAGINPETWITHSGLASEEPLGYLASMQQGDGHIRWKQSQEWHGVWMTAFVGTAMAGDTYLPPPPPYVELPALPPEESTGSTGSSAPGPGNGDGGVGSKGGGVVAGGGGDRAPLFSRPQPASKGQTPGGARRLTSQKHNPHRAHKRNPGLARRRTAPTVTATPARLVPVAHGAGAARSGAGADAKSGAGGSGTEVKGLLIGGLSLASYRHETGAPGLRSAGAGGAQEQWLMIAAYTTIALLVFAGALIEYRRPQVTL